MTIASPTTRSGPYNGNGVTTAFDYEFRIIDQAHLQVILADADGVETVQVLTTDYTVSGVGDADGGQVTMLIAPATGETLVILPNVPFTQNTDLQNQGRYNAEDVEDALDLAVMRDLQMQEQIDRAVKVPASSDPVDLDTLVAAILIVAANVDEVSAAAAIVSGAFPTGGVAGQVLAKSSGTDYDTTWVTRDAISAATRTALKAVSTALARSALLTESGRGGWFEYRSGNYSSQVAADPQEGVYVAPASDATGASGAWVRVRKAREVCAAWFGASTSSAANHTPINAAVDLLQSEGGGTLWVEHFYQVGSAVIVDGSDINLRGTNRSAGLYRTTTGGQVIKFTGSRHSATDLLFAMNVFTTTTTDFVAWVNDAVQFVMERCKIQGGYVPLAITGGACTTTSFKEVVLTFASGTSLVYMADSTDGVNGDHHFRHCTLDQSWPVSSPDGTTSIKGARANTTAYSVGDVVIVGSFYLQCSVAGTSGGSAPTVNVWYGTGITDGTVTWLLVGRVDYSAFDISTNIYYVTVAECDMTGPFQYPVIIRNHLSGDAPNDIHFTDCTAHGPLSIGFYITTGSFIYVDRFNTWSPLDNTAAVTYGVLNAGGTDVWVTRCNIYGFDRGVDVASNKTFVEGNAIVGNTIGVRVAAGVSDFAILGNNLGSAPLGGANTTAASVAAGVSDYYVVANNIVHGASAGVSDGGTGTHKTVTGNQ